MDDGREAALIELTVAAGRSESDRRKLDDLKVCTYADGQWAKTSENLVWKSGARYTLVELPDDDPSCKFSSINHITAADGYTFYYQNDRTLVRQSTYSISGALPSGRPTRMTALR